MEKEIGSIEKGKIADLVAIKLRTEPVYNPITNLVYVGTNRYGCCGCCVVLGCGVLYCIVGRVVLYCGVVVCCDVLCCVVCPVLTGSALKCDRCVGGWQATVERWKIHCH